MRMYRKYEYIERHAHIVLKIKHDKVPVLQVPMSFAGVSAVRHRLLPQVLGNSFTCWQGTRGRVCCASPNWESRNTCRPNHSMVMLLGTR